MTDLRGGGWLIRTEDDPIRGKGWFYGQVDMKQQWIGRCEGPFPTQAAAARELDGQELDQ